ncbi:MAG: hypothetical protein HY279_08170 [Nitrospinae bacterium]|nr:hypothetical protein [Nitrospinota bacterium]
MAQFNPDDKDVKITVDELKSMFYGEYFVSFVEEEDNLFVAKIVIADFLLNNANYATA